MGSVLPGFVLGIVSVWLFGFSGSIIEGNFFQLPDIVDLGAGVLAAIRDYRTYRSIAKARDRDEG